jgi:hypothetical protein
MKPVLVTALVAAGAGVGLRTASQKSALEVAGQFVDMNPVASAECTALLAARGGELGVAVEASGGGKYTVEVSAGEGVEWGAAVECTGEPASGLGYQSLPASEWKAAAERARQLQEPESEPEPEPEPEPGLGAASTSSVDPICAEKEAVAAHIVDAAAADGRSTIGFLPNAKTAQALGFGPR